MTIKIVIRDKANIAILDSAGQAIGLLVCQPGTSSVTKRITRSILIDLDEPTSKVEFIKKEGFTSETFKGNEINIIARVWDEDMDDCTDYVYHLKSLQQF